MFTTNSISPSVPPKPPLPEERNGAPDIISEVSNYFMTILLGKGIILDSEDEKISKWLKKWALDTHLQQGVYKIIYSAVQLGRGLLLINVDQRKDETGNSVNFPWFSIGNPYMWAPVAKRGEIPIQASVWQRTIYDQQNTWRETRYYQDHMEIFYYSEDNVIVNTNTITQVLDPNKYKLKEKWAYNKKWCWIPLEEILFKPVHNYFNMNVANFYPMWWPARKMINKYFQAWDYYHRHQKTARARLLIQGVGASEIAQLQFNFPNNDLADSDIATTTSLGGINPQNDEPIKLLDTSLQYGEYETLFKTYEDRIYRACGLDSPNSSDVQKTEGEIMLENSRQTITIAEKVRYFGFFIKRAIAKCLIIANVVETEELNKVMDMFTFQFMSNTPTDTMSAIEKMTTLINNNLMSRDEAIAQLRGMPLREAKEKAKDIMNNNEEDRETMGIPNTDEQQEKAQNQANKTYETENIEKDG